MPTTKPLFLRLCYLFVFFSLSANAINAETAPTPPDSSALQRLRAWAEQLQSGPLVQNGVVALSVRRVSDGICLFGQHEYTSLSTASTLKLVSTGTALATLGAAFTYTTYLEYDGALRDSTLEGNLYVRGTGDPSLGSGRFKGYPGWAALMQDMAAQVRRLGIRRISGRVVGDGSFYTDQPAPDSWPYGDLGNYYGAGLFGLNINENLYSVYLDAGAKPDAPAPLLRTDPALPYLTFTNRALTGPATTTDDIYLYGAPFQNTVTVTGVVPLKRTNYSADGALPDPAYFTAHALTEQLRRDKVAVANVPVAHQPGNFGSGVVIPGVGANALSVKPLRRNELARYGSPPLSELARETNFESLNLYAEALLRSAGRQLRRGATASWPESISALTTFWQSKGVDVAGFRPRDGSGLSTSGAMTAHNMTSFLAAMTREPVYTDFYASIPVVGQSGTVKNLARNTKAAGNIRAKSGTIEGVRAYAGYFTATDGTRMCFSLMINKYAEGKYRALTPQLERLFVLLVGL